MEPITTRFRARGLRALSVIFGLSLLPSAGCARLFSDPAPKPETSPPQTTQAPAPTTTTAQAPAQAKATPPTAAAATAAATAAPDSNAAVKLPPEQLDALVAPIALYPDALLAQTLVASTYPLEIIQLQQWLTKNPGLKDQALADAVAKQPWDPSIQSMAPVPDVVKRLSDDVQWTTDLGNAFLAQQADVMDAVQRMRQKAKDKGALESNEQQKVETQVVENKTVIVVESTNPEVIYVPSYSPVVVYGPPIYPYPPIYYPPYPPGAAFVTFGMGMMWGAAWGGSCCGCGWGGGGNVYINHNNINNINNINRPGGGGSGTRPGAGGGPGASTRPAGGGSGSNWQHNPQHRGAAPYGDKATANKFGGGTQGNRQAGAATTNRGGAGSSSVGTSNRGGAGAGSASASNRGGASAGTSNRGTGGGDRVGNRSVPQNKGSNAGGFGNSSRGYNGGGARAHSSRGSSSMGGRGGGGRGGRR